ncbi:YfbM family protein [Streptomyces sp. NPDC006307]|uniref:YfbM family protein n=1 Tax=Streptomyces sp. NPDC006307 TaxID=3156748 RepID=UPI0033ADC711
MSMIGEYVRLTPAELERALGDPAWAWEFVEELRDAEPADARCHSTDKAWDAVGFLTRRAGFPVDIVHGEQAVPWDEHWGYGPPRYLTPDQVRAAAEVMAATEGDRLTAGVGPADLAREQVYPATIWERGETLDHVVLHYEALRPFFRDAAGAGDAVMVWIS